MIFYNILYSDSHDGFTSMTVEHYGLSKDALFLKHGDYAFLIFFILLLGFKETNDGLCEGIDYYY